MIALVQRVSRARVEVASRTVGAIESGMLVFVAAEKGDTATQADRLAERLLGYRIFADAQDRMNLSLAETGGAMLLVPQFTLAADTSKGRRPSFDSAAPPSQARQLFEDLVQAIEMKGLCAATGQFGADMQVELVNDGPVTFWLRAEPSRT